MKKKMIVFENKKIRRVWHNGEWFFSVVDVVEVLTDSPTPRQYWGKVKEREFEQIQLSPIWVQLKLEAPDGKMRETDCANKQGIFRIIQSIPSKKAEPFKLWLAKVGSDRVDEIENPELAQERMKKLYEKKGYSKDWIDKRLRGIAIRQNLTDEWKDRGVDENIEYAILTNEISKATFGKTIEEYKKIKNLDKENLRDHAANSIQNFSTPNKGMSPFGGSLKPCFEYSVSEQPMDELELIFGMLGEKVTTEITINKDTKGFVECAVAAKQGGEVAGNARKEAEEKIGRSIILKDNFLSIPEGRKKQKRKKKILVLGEKEE